MSHKMTNKNNTSLMDVMEPVLPWEIINIKPLTRMLCHLVTQNTYNYNSFDFGTKLCPASSKIQVLYNPNMTCIKRFASTLLVKREYT